MEQIKDANNHSRAIISAIELLGYFEISLQEREKLKDFFINLLKDGFVHIKDDKIRLAIKSRIIRCIEIQGLCKNDDKSLDDIFEIFRHETNKDLNSNLLFLIKDYHNVDRLFDYILEEFLRSYDLKPRSEQDKVERGNTYLLKALILKLKSSHKFLEIVQYYINNELNLYYDNDFVVKLSDKCIAFSNKEEDFIVRLLSIIKDETYLHANESLLRNIIIKSNSQEKAINHLMIDQQFYKIRFFIARIVDADTIDIVSRKLIKGKIPDEEIEKFRNYIGNVNPDKELVEKFQFKMQKEGIKFKESFFTEDDLKKKQLVFKNRTQGNLDILFDKETLVDAIENIFIKNKLESISSLRIQKTVI